MEKEALSKYVTYKRKQIGLTQKDLAELLSYTPQAVSRFESVNSAFPLEFSDALCKALNCSLDDIFLRNKEETSYLPLPFPLERIGELIEAKIKESGKSQEEIASSCDITSRSLRNYVTGRGSISLQFLESFCLALSIKPSDLVVVTLVKEEEVPVVQPPVVHRRFYQTPAFVIAVSTLVFMGTVAATIPLWKLPTQEAPHANLVQTSVSESESSTTTVIASPSSEQTSVGKYGLEIQQGVPNFLRIDYSKDTFDSIGDHIEMSFKDAYDDNEISLEDDPNFTIQLVPGIDSTFEIAYEITGKDTVSLSLVGGHNGGGSSLNINLGGYWYYSIGFVYYRTDEKVYIPSDSEHRFPINGGMVHCDFKTDVNLIMSDTHYVSFQMSATYNDNLIPFDEGITPEYMIGDAYTMTSRYQSHNWTTTIVTEYTNNYVEVPPQTEFDTFVVCSWVKVEGDYYYALDPLVIHIVK